MQDHARPRPSAAILLVALASFNLAQAEPVPRSEGIDAVVAVDTLRGPTGAPTSERMVLDLLKHVAAMGVDVRVERLSPELVTPGNILAAIDRLDATRLKDRTLFFYYGGHGATDPRWGHLLTTPGGDLQRAQLVDRIVKKAPRLAVVVTDVCGMEASMDGPGVLVPPPPERRAVENLLLQHTGIVDVNGSTYDLPGRAGRIPRPLPRGLRVSRQHPRLIEAETARTGQDDVVHES